MRQNELSPNCCLDRTEIMQVTSLKLEMKSPHTWKYLNS